MTDKKQSLDAFLKKWDRDLTDDRRCYGLKVCLAGAESQSVRDGLYRIGVRRILVSYYYMSSWFKKRTVEQIADDFGRFDFIFLDSGGFTLLQELQKKGDTKVSLQEYAEDYYAQVKRFGHLFAGCAEVDVYDVLGLEYCDYKRKELLDSGLPIVPVMQGQPIEYYDRLGWFDEHHYIAVGSKFIDNPKYTGYLHDIYKMSEDTDVVLHGLGATNAGTLAQSKFYSVDSTTWLNGSKFGATHLFEHGRIRHYEKERKYIRTNYKKRFEECGLNWEEIENDKGSEVDLMNGLAWAQLGDYLKYNTRNSYWLTAEEKDHALTLKSSAFNAEGIIDRKASLARVSERRLATVTDADYDDRAYETLYCNMCLLEGRCPRFTRNEVCGYEISIRLGNAEDLHKALRVVLEAQYGRVMTGVLFEKMQGGAIDQKLSNEFTRFLEMTERAKRIFEPKPEEELHLHAKGKKGSLQGMLASVFSPTGSGKSGSGNSNTQRTANKVMQDEVIDVEPE